MLQVKQTTKLGKAVVKSVTRRRKRKTKSLWKSVVRQRLKKYKMIVNGGHRNKAPMADDRSPDRNFKDLFGDNYVPDCF